MHTNWCVFIEISMEIGMWNFWNVINGHCTDEKISLYVLYIYFGYFWTTWLIRDFIALDDYLPLKSDIWGFLNPSAYSKIWDHMWTFPNCKWLWPSGHLMILLYMIGNSEFTNGIKRSMKVLILTLIYQGCWNVHTWTKEFVPAMFWQIHQP